jgi:hypothetical protein
VRKGESERGEKKVGGEKEKERDREKGEGGEKEIRVVAAEYARLCGVGRA